MKQISLKNKKVFVAGHNGLVGQALCERLESEYCKVLTVNKKKFYGRPFLYFCYGAAVTEVTIDTLTGENWI